MLLETFVIDATLNTLIDSPKLQYSWGYFLNFSRKNIHRILGERNNLYFFPHSFHKNY